MDSTDDVLLSTTDAVLESMTTFIDASALADVVVVVVVSGSIRLTKNRTLEINLGFILKLIK